RRRGGVVGPDHPAGGDGGRGRSGRARAKTTLTYGIRRWARSFPLPKCEERLLHLACFPGLMDSGVTSNTIESHVRVPSNHLMLDLLGEGDAHLRQLEETFPDVRIVARGNEITLLGKGNSVEDAATVLNELLLLIQEGQRLDSNRIAQVVDMVREQVPSPSGVLSEGLSVGRGKMVRAKTKGQHDYIAAIRENTVTFGLGPAGTGKTYLAMAAAVESLVSGAVRRIVLTRPAVEAGERLG